MARHEWKVGELAKCMLAPRGYGIYVDFEYSVLGVRTEVLAISHSANMLVATTDMGECWLSADLFEPVAVDSKPDVNSIPVRRERAFWLVKGLGSATFEHPSVSSAQTEAERLARNSPGETFTVLGPLCSYRKDMLVTDLREYLDSGAYNDGVPF